LSSSWTGFTLTCQYSPDICLYEFCVAELYHVKRNHQDKDNVLLFTKATRAMDPVDGSVGCKERLGGLLKYYHREAA